MAARISTSGNTYNFKIVLLGEGCVGKTSCVLRYVEDAFNDKHLTTLQVLCYPIHCDSYDIRYNILIEKLIDFSWI